MSTPETRYNNPSVDLKMNSNPVKESEPQNSQSINGNIISINKSKNSDSTNGSSTNNNNSSHKEIIDKEKDEERRIRVIKELEEKREIKEKEIKKEKERIRKALLKVTSIVTFFADFFSGKFLLFPYHTRSKRTIFTLNGGRETCTQALKLQGGWAEAIYKKPQPPPI